jgi:large subunit ribosomal protein L18
MRGTQRRSIFRRRKAGLTDYRRRLKLLRGRKSRAVVRISNTRTTCQLVDWAASGDLVKVTMTGSDLMKKYGWPEDFSQKSVPASYLLALLWARQQWLRAAKKQFLTSV